MPMSDRRKQAISLRINASDLRKVKKLAERLGRRDSDVVRFALKIMLERLGPLCDQNVRGRALVPVIVEAGHDILHHFDLDFTRLEEIVNSGVDKGQEIESEDLQLLAATGIQQTYAQLKLNKIIVPGPDTGRGRAPRMDEQLNDRLRSYFYAKYAETESSVDTAAAAE
jgi:DNA-binding MltR family transcriptional regulator